MNELTDYSGEYNPDIEYSSFSKDVLVKLLEEYARLYLLHDGLWNTRITREFGPETAFAWGNEIWGHNYRNLSLPRISKLFNISGNDVLTACKLIQLTPDGVATGGQYKYTSDVKNNNHVIWTITRCATLEYFEKNGMEKHISGVCGVGGMEHVAIENYCHFVNPDIKVTALKIPPRKSPDELPCQWELKLEE
ncbi:DUF6125 family protein [Chloroflexota bacterium]